MKKHRFFPTLLRFAEGARGSFIRFIIASVLGVAFGSLAPQVVRFTIDSVIGTDAPNMPQFLARYFIELGGRDYLLAHLALCGVGIAVLTALNCLFGYVWRVDVARFSERLIKNMRDRLFTHIQALPFGWHNSNQTGDIIQRCTSDVDTLRTFVATQMPQALRTFILMAVCLALMYSMDVIMAIVATVFLPVIILYSALFHSRISKQFRKADEAEGDLTVAVQENLTGVRVVRAFGRERFEMNKFDKCLDKFTNMWVDLGYTMGWFWGVGDFVSCLQLVVMVCLGSYLAATGRLSLGSLLVFITYTQTMAWPVRNLGRVLSELSKAGVSMERICEILDAEPESEEPDAEKPELHGDIEFRNVSFSYENEPVLRDVSFTVPGGGTVGILGATGSGKSTLTYLLNRLYELPPEQGSISIGGRDVRGMDRGWLRRNVGLVLQEPFLFSRTVADNIRVATRDATIGDVRRCAKIADVDKDIEDFRESYDTVVGERGVTLSGGQKQRVAIARTLIMDCPIMVFDDSMSAVDMETDAKIREALRENTGDATVILISHRINTLMLSDLIVVLDGGRVVDIGTHEQLISRDGIYKRVYLMQSGAYSGEGGEQ